MRCTMSAETVCTTCSLLHKRLCNNRKWPCALASMLENVHHKHCTVDWPLTVLCVFWHDVTANCLYNILPCYGVLFCIASADKCSGIEFCGLEYRKNAPIEHKVHGTMYLFHHACNRTKSLDTFGGTELVNCSTSTASYIYACHQLKPGPFVKRCAVDVHFFDRENPQPCSVPGLSCFCSLQLSDRPVAG